MLRALEGYEALRSRTSSSEVDCCFSSANRFSGFMITCPRETTIARKSLCRNGTRYNTSRDVLYAPQGLTQIYK
jgi:hypothetical protein